ncbi:MAG: uroporphyrinogen-III synthase [Ilumatobacteraceae bacterium]
MSAELAGRRIVTTRDAPGPLDARLAELGAAVVHVPMIEIVDPPDDRLPMTLRRLGEFDWVVVSSRHGARRLAPALALHPGVRVAAVGSVTAESLGTDITPLVPPRQTAADLVRAFPPPSARGRALVVQGDRSDSVVVDGLRALGYDVEAVVAYLTRGAEPTEAHRRSIEGADAVVFASGSAATAWYGAFGDDPSLVVVAIGPTTARVAVAAGLHVDAVAADHSVDGLVDCVRTVLSGNS